MGEYADLFAAQVAPARKDQPAETYRSAWAASQPAAAPAPKGNPVRQSADYKRMMAGGQDAYAGVNRAASGIDTAVQNTLGGLPLVGSLFKGAHPAQTMLDYAQGGLGAIPFSDEMIGMADKGIAGAMNPALHAMGARTIDPEAAYLAGKDLATQTLAQSTKRAPWTTRGTEAVAMLAGPGELKAALKAPGFLAGIGPKIAAKATEIAPRMTEALGASAEGAGEALGKFAPKGSLARTLGTAGLLGGLYGAGEGEGDERLGNAQRGAELSMLLAGPLHYLAPAVAKLPGVGLDLGRKLGGMLTRVGGGEDPALAPMTDAQGQQAASAVAQQAARAGVGPEDVSRIWKEKFGNAEGVTGADIVGRGGVTALGAVARRPGATADLLEPMLRERAVQEPSRIMTAAGEHLGVDPETAGQGVDDLIEQLQKEAGPLWKAATAGPHGVTSPELERLLNSSEGQRIAAKVNKLAKSAGNETEGIAYAPVERPEDFQGATGAHPNEAPPVGNRIIAPDEQPLDLGPAEQVPLPKGPDIPPSQGKPFLRWLAEQGGVMNDGGEMGQMDLSKLGSRSMNANTRGLDELTMRARDAGYWPTGGEPPSHNDFLEAIRANAAGKIRYSSLGEGKPTAKYEARQAAKGQNRSLESEQANRQAESDQTFRAQQAKDEQATEEWRKAMAETPTPEEYRSLDTGTEAPQGGGTGLGTPPGFEPARQVAPTPQGWDLLRREANRRVEYDNLTGQLVASGTKGSTNLMRKAFAKKLTTALAGEPGAPGGAIPAMRGALDKSSDKLEAQRIMEALKNKLTHGDVGTFTRAWRALKTDGQKAIGRAAIARDMVRLADAGLLRGGRVSGRGMQQKLEMAFGKQGAADFVKAMEREITLSRNTSRMMPGLGSGTSEWQQALGGGDTEGPMSEAIAEAAGHVAKGNLGGAFLAALKAAPGDAMAYGRTSGMPVQVLDEYGRLLMADPESFAAFLRSQNPADLRIKVLPVGQAAAAAATETKRQSAR